MSSVTAWLASGAYSLLLNSMLARECPSLSAPHSPHPKHNFPAPAPLCTLQLER